MKGFFFVFLMIVNLFASGTISVVKVAEKSTFRVINIQNDQPKSIGTGFIINKDGYCITNNHVTKNADQLFLINKFIKYTEVELIKTYPKKDISILKIKNYSSDEYLKLQKPDMIKVENHISTLGYPGASDIIGDFFTTDASIKKGIISKLPTANGTAGFPNGYKFIEIDATINKGNSGGPLLSSKGHIVGVNTLGTAGKYKLAKGVYWSIHVSELIKVLDANNIKYTISTDSMDIEENNGSSLNIFLVLIILAVGAVIIFFIKKQKATHITSTVDERELSKIVRDKMKKYDSDTPSSPTPSNKKVINTKLYPQNSSLPIIEATHKDTMSLGRGSDNDIVISNEHISGNHLLISILGTKVIVVDLGSTNGTYIEGSKLKPHQKTQLQKNQNLIIGSEDTVYSIGN